MKVLVWLLRGIIFVALFGLAVKNSGPVDLRFYLDNDIRVPLSVVILAAFAGGVLVGLTASLFGRLRRSKGADNHGTIPGGSQ